MAHLREMRGPGAGAAAEIKDPGARRQRREKGCDVGAVIGFWGQGHALRIVAGGAGIDGQCRRVSHGPRW